VGWLLSRPLPEDSIVVVNLSGRGDKDLDTVRKALAAPETSGAAAVDA
jgi:tryptophan synthase beta subunit